MYICKVYINYICMLDPVALRIRELIDKKGLSNAEFANMVELSPSIVSHILNGRNKVSIQVLEKIRTHFTDVNTDYLLMGLGSLIRKEEVKNTLKASASPTLSNIGHGTADSKSSGEANEELPENLQIPRDGVFHASIPGSTPLIRVEAQKASEAVFNSDFEKDEPVFSENMENQIASEKSHYQNSKNMDSKKVVKIVMFYSDNSFEVFNSN